MNSAAYIAAASLAACGLTAGLTLLTIRICRRRGWLSRPRADRWHTGTPAFFGGIPVWIGWVAAVMLLAAFGNRLPHAILAVSSLAFMVGLLDDVRHLRPRTKLLLVAAAACVAVACGAGAAIFGSATLNLLFSALWIVAITNAFNLLDNMDGLSPGIALISSLFLGYLLLEQGHRELACVLFLLAGSVAGFLVFNFHPARIFMGDCGSLFVGFVLGWAALPITEGSSSQPLGMLIAISLLAVPVLDMGLVSVTRRLRGQPISQGGTDHSSHRLVRLGSSERATVLLAYGVTTFSGGLALLASQISVAAAFGVLGTWWLVLVMAEVRLFCQEILAGASRGSHTNAVGHVQSAD